MPGGKLIIVSAPSGAGKTTIVKHLLSLPLDLEFSVSATSRTPRTGEINGRDYFFISMEEFKKKITEKAFVEWEEVYPGIYYGTLKSEIDRIFADLKNVIFDVDVIGGMNLRKIFGKKALSLYVMPPSLQVLEQRLRSRSTETDEKIATRLEKAAYEITFASRFDRIIINDKLETTLREAETIVHDFISPADISVTKKRRKNSVADANGLQTY
jgi:guanylate kinase